MTRLSLSAGKKTNAVPEGRVVIGRVGAPHGVRGEMCVIPLTDFVDRFRDMKEVMVGDELLHIESCRFHKQFVILRFREYPVREDAMQLTGKVLTVSREETVPLEDGVYYTFDIIGLRVFDPSGVEIGVVENVMRTGSNDVYQVRRSDGSELLVPALKAVVKEIDIKGGRMVVDMPDTLEA